MISTCSLPLFNPVLPTLDDAQQRHRRPAVGRVGIYLATGGEFPLAAVTREAWRLEQRSSARLVSGWGAKLQPKGSPASRTRRPESGRNVSGSTDETEPALPGDSVQETWSRASWHPGIG